MKINKASVLLLLSIIALGFFLRFVNIESAPPGVYPDEAVNGIDAATANETGNYQWFYEANNGREGLFMNMIALCFQLLGISVLSLKLPSIIFGTLAILGTFLLARELFQKTRIGLMAAFLVATAFWAINFSRISFRANMMPAILAFTFYFLMRGMRTKKLSDFAVSGAIFGLGLHTYLAFRIAPAIMVVMFFVFIFTRQNFIRTYWKNILVWLLFCLLFAAPLLYTFYIHPEYIQSRTGNISILNPEINQGHALKAFFRTFSLSLLKYNVWGDQNWRHNYPPYPILDPFTGVLFTFGLVYSVIRFFHLASLRIFKGERHSRLETHSLLLSWFFIMLAAEFMSYEGNPHALRSIGTLVPAFIFAALAIDHFLRRTEKYSYSMKLLSAVIVVFMLIFVGTFNAVKYHFFWAKKIETARSFDKNLMEVSAYIQNQPQNKEIYVIVESMQRIPIQLFNWKRPDTHYIYPGEIGNIEPVKKDPAIILTDYNDGIICNLKDRFPELELEEKKDGLGMSFYVLK